jgi:hypothetical protein
LNSTQKIIGDFVLSNARGFIIMQDKSLKTRIAEIRDWANGNYPDGKPHIDPEIPSWTKDLLEALDIEKAKVDRLVISIHTLLSNIKSEKELYPGIFPTVMVTGYDSFEIITERIT